MFKLNQKLYLLCFTCLLYLKYIKSFIKFIIYKFLVFNFFHSSFTNHNCIYYLRTSFLKFIKKYRTLFFKGIYGLFERFYFWLKTLMYFPFDSNEQKWVYLSKICPFWEHVSLNNYIRRSHTSYLTAVKFS